MREASTFPHPGFGLLLEYETKTSFGSALHLRDMGRLRQDFENLIARLPRIRVTNRLQGIKNPGSILCFAENDRDQTSPKMPGAKGVPDFMGHLARGHGL